MNTCPVSTARLEKEIHYLSEAELQRVDLYGYTSMTSRRSRCDKQELAELRREVETLRREMAEQRATCGK